MNAAEKKIDALIEENLLKTIKDKVTNSSGKTKAMLLAGAGGALGSGLDLYLSGKVDFGDFVKPMSAWAAGSALGAVGASENTKNLKEK